MIEIRVHFRNGRDPLIIKRKDDEVGYDVKGGALVVYEWEMYPKYKTKRAEIIPLEFVRTAEMVFSDD